MSEKKEKKALQVSGIKGLSKPFSDEDYLAIISAEGVDKEHAHEVAIKAKEIHEYAAERYGALAAPMILKIAAMSSLKHLNENALPDD